MRASRRCPDCQLPSYSDPEYQTNRRTVIAEETDCRLCGKPVDTTLRYPHPMSPSSDHTVRLADGGTHRRGNLGLAHLVCNSRAGARAA